jgi:hypothetical protein
MAKRGADGVITNGRKPLTQSQASSRARPEAGARFGHGNNAQYAATNRQVIDFGGVVY